jgi:hypothetical protein
MGRSQNAVRVLAATLVPEHCRSGHCGDFCRWSHRISSAVGQLNCWRLLKMCPASQSVKARFFTRTAGGLQTGSGTIESRPLRIAITSLPAAQTHIMPKLGLGALQLAEHCQPPSPLSPSSSPPTEMQKGDAELAPPSYVIPKSFEPCHMACHSRTVGAVHSAHIA